MRILFLFWNLNLELKFLIAWLCRMKSLSWVRLETIG